MKYPLPAGSALDTFATLARVADTCTHIAHIQNVAPVAEGCVECLATGGHWLHLRRCLACGHIGCCDNSPNRHATKHFHQTEHPLIQSFEPGEDWIYCYVDDVAFELENMLDSPSHP